ncbi:MAG: carboxypeptidase regulatory-like domain-containing protein [Gemmatimonadales bacterium]
MVRRARRLAFAAVALTLGAGELLAQGAGKIEGRVRDQTGAPIASAQVVIVGTAFATRTSNTGYYFFNNVPVGTINVRAAAIGYRPTEATGVRVLAGQTVTQDIQLEQTAVEIESINIVETVNPLVPRDAVTTKQLIDGEFSSKLPVDRLANLFALVPGVTSTPNGTALSIRGGRTDQAAVYIDGVPVASGFRGTGFVGSGGTTISVGTNAIEQAAITTGAPSSEFGNAQSGIVSIETRSGGQQLHGSLGYETDEPLGVNHGYGFNRIQGSLGGPLPLRNLTFFVSGVLEGRQAAPAGVDADKFPVFVQSGVDTTVAVPSALNDPNADTTVVDVQTFSMYRGRCDAFSGSANRDIASNYGIDCQGIRTPNTASTLYETTAKLNYTFGTGNRLFLSWQGSRNQGRLFNYNNLYNPQVTQGFRVWNNIFTLGLTQNLSKSADRALALDLAVSYQQDRTINSPLTRQSELDTRDPFGGFIIGNLGFMFDFDNFPLNQELVDNFRNNTPGSRRSPIPLENTAQYSSVDQYRNNAYGLLGFNETGTAFGGQRLNLFKEDRWVFKGTLDWQLDRYNRLKLGGDYTRYDISNYSHQLLSQAFSDVYMETPIRYNLFAENRLDLGDVVVVGGLRYDFYDSRASRPFVLDTLSSSPTFGEYTFFPRISSYGSGGTTFNGLPLVEFKRDKSHNYLSPHIQVSFPVTDRTNFRLSYAHQVQAPDFSLILGGINTDLAVTNTNHVYGADLDFGKTISFEFGIRHAFSDDMVLDISAYNRDNLSDAAGRLVSFPDPLRQGAPVDVRVITNADFGNTRGIDLRLDRRIGRFFNGSIAYTYQSAKNTGSNPFTYINFGSRIINQVSGGNQPPPQGIFPTGNSRPHNLAGSFALTVPSDWKEGSTIGNVLRGVGVTALFRYSSGTAYTRCPPESGNEGVISGQVCSREFAGDFFGARRPSFKQLDMKFTKSFGLRGLDITAYLDARNVLNFENILNVFATTNDVVNARELDVTRSADSAGFASEASANGVYGGDGSVDLRFGGALASGCGNWVNAQSQPSTPNCVYLIRAEERYGNGDHVFDLAEQERASKAAYLAGGSISNGANLARGINAFTGEPRRLRLGFEVNF